MNPNAGLSDAERDFRDLVSNPARRDEYLAWSETVRLDWERDNVVWLHGYANGKAVWRRERPPPEPEQDEPAAPSSRVRGKRYAYTGPR